MSESVVAALAKLVFKYFVWVLTLGICLFRIMLGLCDVRRHQNAY